VAESEQVVRFLMAFGISLLIIYMTAKLLGEERKALWFKKRQRTTIFTRRGLLGEVCHFGVPCKWQGAVTMLVMFGIIGIISYMLVFNKCYY
jgi:hypothetical protein